MNSKWLDFPYHCDDAGYIVVINQKIVAWCHYYKRSGRWYIVEPFYVLCANGKEQIVTTAFDV